MRLQSRLFARPRPKAGCSWGCIASVKYWEIIADNLSKAGWSWGWVSAVNSKGRTIWIADAHRGDGKRYVVHADEKPTAFVEGSVQRESSVLARTLSGLL